MATARGRVGYAAGPWLAYATGGLAFAGERFLNSPAIGSDEKVLNTRLGWAAGGGLEYAFAPHWSARLEYLYSQFERTDIRFPSATQYASTLDFQSLRVGLNRKIDWPGSGNFSPASLTDPESDRWEIHGQTTLPAARLSGVSRALYGPNSLTPAPQLQATWSNSLFLNARLWEGGEVYYNPELLQGFGLNDTVGVADFRAARRRNPTFPIRITTPRGCFCARPSASAASRKNLPADRHSSPSKVDVSRLTLQAGKFAVIDIFDGNAYAKDTRKDFMNWSMWAPGAFDYSADKVGLTYGATAELNQKQWALRGGYFLMHVGLECEQFRHQDLRARQLRARTGNALFAVLPARKTADHRLAQQRLFRKLPRDAEQSGARSRYRANPHGPHQIRLRHQSRTGLERRHRIVRPLELERRQDRDHGVHRYRRQPLARRLDQGRQMGPARRRDRDRRRDQRAVHETIATSSRPAGSAF